MKDFIYAYLDNLSEIINMLETENIVKVIEELRKTNVSRRKIFVFGNGGSAATANHFVCDLGKNAIRDEKERFKIISLCDNIPYVTAYGNDVGYESIFEEQLKNLMESRDMVICISASGNSSNIIKAVNYAKKKKGTVVSITGFKGGKVREMSDININVSSDSYEKIEDIHLIIMHIIVYWFKQNQNIIQQST
jgi:D-sedoheptulose 7-phosphate isomerase